MSDLTPPPDEPLPDQARARIRADLLAAAQDGGPGAGGRGSRWVVPGVAAAAVVLVAGLATWAVQLGGDGGSPGVAASSTTPGGPAAGGEGTVVATTKPGAMSSSVPPEPDGQVGRRSCEDELVNVLPGATRSADFGDGTSFWVAGGRFALCDVRGGITTVHHPLPLAPAEDVETYRVSSVYLPAGGGGFDVTRVAGGVVPEGALAYDVEYTFPDGRTVPAETATGADGRTWWRVVHAYPSGGNEMKDPPITVQVSYSGVRQTYRLDWATDTCAQANHGC